MDINVVSNSFYATSFTQLVNTIRNISLGGFFLGTLILKIVCSDDRLRDKNF